MWATLRIAIVASCALGAGSCATAMTVSSHAERGLDLSRYRTFEWALADALPRGDARLEKDPFFTDYVRGAIEKGLSAKGLELTTAESPDLLIHYHASITKRINVIRGSAPGDRGRGDSPPEIVEYEGGTLVLDIVDARSNQLIWRGWAQNDAAEMLNQRDRMAKTIERAVARILLRLPPKPSL